MRQIEHDQVFNLCEELERELEEYSDASYVEACDEISGWFDASATAKREEMKNDR